MSQGVENQGSLIGVPLALSVFSSANRFERIARVATWVGVLP